MNAKELSEKAGITVRHASYILGGERRPSAGLAVTLEKVTGIKAEAWIFPDKHENPLIRKDEVRAA